MDVSSDYVKMCEKADEIQGQWILQDNDTYYWVENRFGVEYPRINKWCVWCAEENGLSLPTNAIWLPTQPQLQKMLGRYLWQLNFDFVRWLCDEPYDGHIRHKHLDFTSMEQLWLAFVLKEKYNKVWLGEDWIDG